MAVAAQFDYRQIARQRWPIMDSITGSGPYALISRCGCFPVVRLFENWNEMRAASGQPCGAQICKIVAHSEIKLEKPAPRRRYFRSLADMEKDT